MSLEGLIILIADLKNELHNLRYGDIRYDELENKLHDFEDQLLQLHGDYLTGVLQSIHSKYCSEQEVLTPLAYLGRNYIRRVDNTYDVEAGQGALVDVSTKNSMPSYLVIVPGPLRILKVKGDNSKQVVWAMAS